MINVTWTFWRLIISNQIKFISSKQKYKITRTKTIQLVSYGLRKVLKRHGYLRQKRKQIEKIMTSFILHVHSRDIKVNNTDAQTDRQRDACGQADCFMPPWPHYLRLPDPLFVLDFNYSRFRGHITHQPTKFQPSRIMHKNELHLFGSAHFQGAHFQGPLLVHALFLRVDWFKPNQIWKVHRTI